VIPSPSVCQVAFSTTDLERTHAWYREPFGFLPSGGTRIVRGPLLFRQVVGARSAEELRKSWIRMPPGPPGDLTDLHRQGDHRVAALGPSSSRWSARAWPSALAVV